MHNSIPTKGSSLAEQIYLLMKDCFFPGSGTMGEYFKKTTLLQFVQNSGMPLGHQTLSDATGLENEWLKYAVDNLKSEGYIKEIDSPASFLFPGDAGIGYELVMDAKEAENEANKVLAEGNKDGELLGVDSSKD